MNFGSGFSTRTAHSQGALKYIFVETASHLLGHDSSNVAMGWPLDHPVDLVTTCVSNDVSDVPLSTSSQRIRSAREKHQSTAVKLQNPVLAFAPERHRKHREASDIAEPQMPQSRPAS